MSELTLEGCRTAPLGSYLQALGVLRVVTRTMDPEATGCWRRQRFVLGSRFGSASELIGELVAKFEPEAIISPWNNGSGFSKGGTRPTAGESVQWVRASIDPRLARLRACVSAADHVVTVGLDRGWGGSGKELWDKSKKRLVLQLCRNVFPDSSLAWVDAVAALGADINATYSRLLGTGGNFGSQELSATYLKRVRSVLSEPQSEPWLRSALVGDESVPYLRDTVGQFDPGRAGGVQSSPYEKADEKGFVNPWAFVLTLEGALLLGGAVVRRLGADFSRPSLPFQVRGSTAGFASSAVQEASLGEIWLPEWLQPARLPQIKHLFAEGRAQWRGGPARDGLDFARAAATLGVDRGIDAFSRHVFVDRLGQNPLAVPAGRIVVKERSGVGLLRGLDGWLSGLHGDRVSAGTAAGVRRVEQSLFDLAVGSGGLVGVFVSLGPLVEAVHRSGAAQEAAQPLELQQGKELLDEFSKHTEEDLELRLALGVATLHDSSKSVQPLRSFLHPVAPSGKKWDWTHKTVAASLSSGVGPALAEVARRRAFPGTVPELVTDRPLSMRGSRVTYENGLVLGTADRLSFVGGHFDRQRFAALLTALLCVTWPKAHEQLPSSGDSGAPNPALDLLLQFATAKADPLFVRPGANWPALLLAGRVREVLSDARRRVTLAGRRFVIDPAEPEFDPHFLAGSLLLRSTPKQRVNALARIALPEEKTA